MLPAAMDKRNGSLLFVVDTDILRAAGHLEGDSSKARKILNQIFIVCHQVLLSNEARAEWDADVSRFAQTWRTVMTRRGKIKSVTLQLARHEEMLDNCGLESGQLCARKKDLHLVVAALEHGDNIVISKERRAANGFRDLSHFIKEYGAVSWWNLDHSVPPRSPE